MVRGLSRQRPLALPGPHGLSFQVSQIETGGNWLVSAIYYAYGAPPPAE